MCGIFGVVSEAATWLPDENRFSESARLLSHRGPDATGVRQEPGLGIAHTRLSLVDLDARSNQPFEDGTGRYALIYNGEVYNFLKLRGMLEREGVTFRTQSDTEVVLQMLIHRPAEKALAALNGMFGLAFIDRHTRKVILARDRFGMKPLNWARIAVQGGEALAFGSEIKAFSPWMELRPDRSALVAYLLKHPSATRGRTFYEGIRSLDPGEMLTFEPGKGISHVRFASASDFLDAGEAERLAAMKPNEVVDHFEEKLAAAVELQLLADAPVGAFCSGGVDSSVIVALAARTRKDIALFHANVKGPWSELEPAKALARHLKLELHTVDADEQDFVDMIPRVMRHYEQPFSYHPNCPPLMMIAGLARRSGVKALLSGEGSDELFLGYPWLGRKKLTDAYETAVAKTLKGIRAIPGFGPILVPDRAGNQADILSMLTAREIEDDQHRVSQAISDFAPAARDATHLWTLDYLNLHLRTLLHRNDTMGMSASIEARFPFLDHDVARLGVNLPGAFKLRRSPLVWEKAHPFMRDKWIVRAVADRLMPRNLSQRIKVGFWTTTFQRMEPRPEFFETSRLADVFGMTGAQLRETAAGGSHDLRLRLLHGDMWMRAMIDGESEAVSVARLRDNVRIRGQSEPSRYAHSPMRRRAAGASF